MRLVALYDGERQHYRRSAADAAEALRDAGVSISDAGNADLAAWTIVANVLLNLDETVTKE